MEMGSSSLCLDALLITRPQFIESERRTAANTCLCQRPQQQGICAPSPTATKGRKHRSPSLPRRPRDSLSRRNRQMERARRKLTARARSQSGRALFLLESGPIHLIRRLREGAAGQHLLRRRALLRRPPRLYGGWRGRRGARRDGDRGPAPWKDREVDRPSGRSNDPSSLMTLGEVPATFQLPLHC
jgi:hypothetical protein